MKKKQKAADILMKICLIFSIIAILGFDNIPAVITFVETYVAYRFYKILENTKYCIVSPILSIIYLIVIFIFTDFFEKLGIADFFGTISAVLAIYSLAGGLCSLINLMSLREKSKDYVSVIAKVVGHLKNSESEFDFKACYYEYEYNDKKYNVLYNYFDDNVPSIGDYVDIKVNINNPEIIYSETLDDDSNIVTWVLLGSGIIFLIVSLILFLGNR